jgi:phage/plasmid-associated DNA primase
MLDLNLAGLQSESTDEEKVVAWREANEAADNDNGPKQPASAWSVSPWSVPAGQSSLPKRYVKTKDAERLVRGHAEEILGKLGVQWPGRSTHIQCPLGIHPDNNPSWRWDKSCDRYFCTCGNGSIFDVVMRICRVDFDRAKLHVAELFGRTDLVHEVGGGARPRGVSIADVAVAKGLPVEFLRHTMCWQDHPRYGKFHQAAIIMPWFDGQGGQWNHIRASLEGDRRFFWEKGHKQPPLYGMWLPMPEAGYIVLVEGETDVATLLFTGFSAWGIAGAPGGWNEHRHAHLVESFGIIFVVIEPGEAGEELARRIARSRIAPKVRFTRMTPELKDPNKVYLADREHFVENFRALLRAATPCVPQPETSSSEERRDLGVHAVSRKFLNIGSDVEIANCVAEDLLKKYGDVCFDDGGFYRYTGTHWDQIEEVEHRRAIHSYDGATYLTPQDTLVAVQLNKSRVNSILHEMRAITSRPNMFKDAPTGINCASGFIRFENEGVPRLVPHDRAHAQRHVLDGRWHPGAPAMPPQGSLLDTLLHGIFKGDHDEPEKIRLVSQISGCAALGYATKLGRPRAIIAHGQSAENGKSQVLDMLRGLLPPGAVSSIPATKFGDQSFLVGLAGKYLNATDELKGTGAISSETFKAVVTGELVTARDLYRSAIEFRPVALQIHATNVLPTFEGGFDRGVLRRLLLLVFNRVIPEKERINDLGKRIAVEEPDLLLAFAVGGASDLIKSGNFIVPQSSQKGLEKWSGSADPVIAWASACLETDPISPGQKIVGHKSGAVHAKFKDWAVAEGYRADSIPAVNGFVQRLQAALPGVRSRHTNAGNYLVGFKIVERFARAEQELDA